MPLRPTTPEELTAENYYRDFEFDLWNFGVLAAGLPRLDIPASLAEPLRQKDRATLLVLGSAAGRNVDHMAIIDKFLRPGKGRSDTVYIVDRNEHALAINQRRIDEIEDFYAKNPADEPDPLPYPHFTTRQADITALPQDIHGVDVAVSHFTFNFLPSLDQIDTAFGQIHRVLSPGGIALMALDGHPSYLPGEYGVKPCQGRMLRDVIITKFPLQAYVQSAEQQGLAYSTGSIAQSRMTCGVFHKPPLS
jgi:SAM-dependent methyltransferase